MKRESRVLVVDSVDGIVLCILFRGSLGIEHVMAFRDCTDLAYRLSRRRGVWGEVSYIAFLSDACVNTVRELGYRLIDYRSLPLQVIEQVKVIRSVVARSMDVLRMIGVLSADEDDDKPTR